MSRITGTDAFNMMEAYNAVYAPQEINEEQVWEEVEAWVNSLVEEGYDLSEYTWEDMYEHFINEDLIGDLLANRAKIGSAVRGAATRVGQAASNVNQAMINRINPSNFQNTGGFGRYQQPTSQQYGNQSRFAGARDAAFARARQIKGSPVVGPRVAAPAAQVPARPATAPARPPAAPAGTSRPNASTRPATPSYSGATGVRPVGTPLPTNAVTPVAGAPAQNAPVSAPASRPSLATQAAELRAMRKASQQRIIAQGGTPATPLVQSFDPFDIVMGYLIDEGYAENEEAASVIMANMSEEWRDSIIEQQVVSDPGGKGGKVTAGAEYPAVYGGKKGMKFTSATGTRYFTPNSEGSSKPTPSK